MTIKFTLFDPVALIALLGVPLGLSIAATVPIALKGAAWAALWADPQTCKALALTLWTGLASALLAVVAAAVLLYNNVNHSRWAGLMTVLARCWPYRKSALQLPWPR